MLLELRVENYAVIDSVVVEFAPGLNLLTGETGAGKSLLIGALALLLGEKASSDVVRHGADKAVVAGVFDIDEKRIASVLESNGLDGNANELILRREISAGGKGRVFVNNQAATVGVLKQFAPWLGAIHSQSESMFAFAFDAGARRALLDSFAAAATEAAAPPCRTRGRRARPPAAGGPLELSDEGDRPSAFGARRRSPAGERKAGLDECGTASCRGHGGFRPAL